MPADPSSQSDAYLDALRREFPALRVVDKERNGFCRAIDAALRALTLGRQSAFQTRYVTTIGSTIYVPADWHERSDEDRYITLRHEAVHLRQFRRLGLVPMSLLYLLPLLPMGLALGRARLEWEAYRETLRATAEVRGPAAAAALEDRIVSQFTSGAYGWMWPFPRVVRRWVRDALAEEKRQRESPSVS